jgi:rod shape-determining protein MreC
MELMRPFQMMTSHFSHRTSSVYENYISSVDYRAENAKLKVQVARLQSDETRIQELENENHRLSELLELKQVLGLRAVAAEVIGSDATGLARTLMISQGEDEGLKLGMAVLSNQGIVGKIIAVSPSSSKVLLIHDHNSALDAFDQRSRARGIISGVVDNGMIMKYVERGEDVKIGDTVISSGFDGIFPRGLLVGRVTAVERKGLFLNVELAAAVDFRRLEQVLVVTQPPPAQVAEQGQS